MLLDILKLLQTQMLTIENWITALAFFTVYLKTVISMTDTTVNPTIKARNLGIIL